MMSLVVVMWASGKMCERVVEEEARMVKVGEIGTTGRSSTNISSRCGYPIDGCACAGAETMAG